MRSSAGIRDRCPRRGVTCAIPVISAVLLGLVSCSTLEVESVASTPAQMTLGCTPTTRVEDITISIVYDNHKHDPRLRPDWGFSCVIERGETTLLFDTGGDGGLILKNLAQLELDPLNVDQVFLSHIHGDHTAGLEAILGTGAHPAVWVPASFPTTFVEGVDSRTEVREVSSPVTMFQGAHSTGELGSGIIEQSLFLETSEGLVVVTGCAHPGILCILSKVKELHPADLSLVVGGFHLRDKPTEELEHIVAQMHSLGVQRVAPCHCTGDEAIRMFSEEWGDGFVQVGVGRVIEILE